MSKSKEVKTVSTQDFKLPAVGAEREELLAILSEMAQRSPNPSRSFPIYLMHMMDLLGYSPSEGELVTNPLIEGGGIPTIILISKDPKTERAVVTVSSYFALERVHVVERRVEFHAEGTRNTELVNWRYRSQVSGNLEEWSTRGRILRNKEVSSFCQRMLDIYKGRRPV